MENYFGVSSLTPANQKLKNGYTLCEWAMRQHYYPLFWGRQLVGDNAITKEEYDYLKSKGIKTMLLINHFSEQDISKFDGTMDALEVVEVAKSLGVPQNQNIALYVVADSDGSINHNWMISFAHAVKQHGYIAGFIGNTDSSMNFNFDRQCSHFVLATSREKQYGAVYGATEPKCEYAPTEWSPYCPSALEPEHIGFWVYNEVMLDANAIGMILARDENSICCLW